MRKMNERMNVNEMNEKNEWMNEWKNECKWNEWNEWIWMSKWIWIERRNINEKNRCEWMNE